MDMTPLPSAEQSRKTLGLGLAVVAVILVSEALVDAYLTGSAQTRAQQIERQSMAGVELVDRIIRDVNQQRVLIDDHIDETTNRGMSEIEARLAATTADLDAAKQMYLRHVDRPSEAVAWRQVLIMLGRFDGAIGHIMPISRHNLDAQARAESRIMRSDYQQLDDQFKELLRINRAGAAESMQQISNLRRTTDIAVLGLRIGELLALGLLGWWAARRITLYENQLLEYAQALADQNRNLDAFAGRVAHDIKNTLAPIALSPPLLRRWAGNGQRVSEIADRTERATGRAVAVVDALLAFSRSSYVEEDEECSGLHAAVQDVVDELSPLARQIDASITIGELPDAFLRCSPGLLHIVLANVMGNAVKYLDQQTERKVRVSASADGASCRIEVADTGPGIPASAQAKIFEPFFRVEGVRVPGIGIGLATVRRIVETRGGQVTVRSTEGHGATFSVWLPFAQSHQEHSGHQAGRTSAAHS
ncbi:MAG TPA: HAMP domain-containing sensor histidine kinase [Polyangia bacterium]|jgi:signal transduction histidine kinase|nr:HAMP domain-containing sensor histidine kinase [Polyangia bacterium]